MSAIQSLRAEEIHDSRGNPTLEVTCTLENGSQGTASVPSGKSTGTYEAVELRDGDVARHNGMGVLHAVSNINGEIASSVVGKDFNQKSFDEALIALDGSINKGRLGANALLGSSVAFARAVAEERGVELYVYIQEIARNTQVGIPLPMFNIINGGKHAESGLDIQEFLICPLGIDGIEKQVSAGVTIIDTLQEILSHKGYETTLGDEGGFAPKLASNEEAFNIIGEAIERAGYTKETIRIGIDVASTSFFKNERYSLKVEEVQKQLTKEELLEWYTSLIATYNLLSIEDGLHEEDFDGFAEMMKTFGSTVKVVGDDLTVTNVERMKKARTANSVNTVIIKPNQIGTVTETLEAIHFAKDSGWSVFVSHRSGETMDTFIADLAVGVGADFIKAGSLTRKERMVKYERLVQIRKSLMLSQVKE